MRRPRLSGFVADTASLYAVQGLNYLFPLLLLPVLVRAVGPSGFGTLNLALAFGGYVQVLGDFGFALTGTRQIALSRDSRDQLHRIASEITWAKIAILVCSGLLAQAVVWTVPAWRPDAPLFLLAILAAAGNSLFPTWLFQGMQRMIPPAVLSAVAKAANLGLVLVLVRAPDDLPAALWIGAALAWMQTLSAYALAFFYWSILPARPRIHAIARQCRQSASVFLSQIGVLFYSNTNTVVLGLYCSREDVGAFALAEKIIRAASFLAAPLCSAIYPRVCQLLDADLRDAERFLRRILYPGAIFFTLLALVLATQSSFLLGLLSPNPPHASHIAMLILAPLPLSIFLDSLYGTQIVLGTGKDRDFARAILTSGLAALLLQQLLIPRWGAPGAAFCLMLAEILLLTQFIVVSRRIGVRLVPTLGF